MIFVSWKFIVWDLGFYRVRYYKYIVDSNVMKYLLGGI